MYNLYFDRDNFNNLEIKNLYLSLNDNNCNELHKNIIDKELKWLDFLFENNILNNQ